MQNHDVCLPIPVSCFQQGVKCCFLHLSKLLIMQGCSGCCMWLGEAVTYWSLPLHLSTCGTVVLLLPRFMRCMLQELVGASCSYLHISMLQQCANCAR